jgi:hypothetical protein
MLVHSNAGFFPGPRPRRPSTTVLLPHFSIAENQLCCRGGGLSVRRLEVGASSPGRAIRFVTTLPLLERATGSAFGRGADWGRSAVGLQNFLPCLSSCLTCPFSSNRLSALEIEASLTQKCFANPAKVCGLSRSVSSCNSRSSVIRSSPRLRWRVSVLRSVSLSH